MEIVNLKLTQLEPNTGQIEGLPLNPRQWTKTDIDKLAVSLTETPELFEARPIICVPHGGKYVILGGNLRYEASKANKANEVPCVVLPEDMPIAKMKEIVIKDNGAFGAWDFDELANEWDDLPLTDWGVPAWDAAPIDESAVDALFEEAAQGKAKDITLTITIPPEQEEYMEDIKASVELTLAEWAGCKVK